MMNKLEKLIDLCIAIAEVHLDGKSPGKAEARIVAAMAAEPATDMAGGEVMEVS